MTMKPELEYTAGRLVDAHVHIKDIRGLDAVRAAGVVAVRDAGVRENIAGESGPREIPGAGPLVVGACWAIYKKGGYGSALGAGVESRTDISAEIIKLARAGAAIIKVMASGIVSLREPGKITTGGFRPEELVFIVHEASRAGLAVMAHANGEQAIIAASRAGVRSIEHGFFMTDRALDAMARERTFWVPTVGALERAASAGGASTDSKVYINTLIKSHLKMIWKAKSAGVPLAIGTDCVLPCADYKDAYTTELAFFEQTGLSHDEVLQIAVEGGSTLLGVGKAGIGCSG